MAYKTLRKRRAREDSCYHPRRGVVAAEPPPELEHPLALKCKACGGWGRYHVGSVLLDPSVALEQEIEDSLSFTGYFRCRACDSPGPWELAASAVARVSAYFLSFMTQEDDVPSFVGEMRMFDGRHIRTCAEGVDHLRELIAHDERNAFLWVRLGNLFDRGGETDGAFQAYQRAAELDETDIEAHYPLGELLVDRGDYEDAAPHLHAVLKHARESTELRSVSARLWSFSFASTGARREPSTSFRNRDSRTSIGRTMNHLSSRYASSTSAENPTGISCAPASSANELSTTIPLDKPGGDTAMRWRHRWPRSERSPAMIPVPAAVVASSSGATGAPASSRNESACSPPVEELECC